MAMLSLLGCCFSSDKAKRLGAASPEVISWSIQPFPAYRLLHAHAKPWAWHLASCYGRATTVKVHTVRFRAVLPLEAKAMEAVPGISKRDMCWSMLHVGKTELLICMLRLQQEDVEDNEPHSCAAVELFPGEHFAAMQLVLRNGAAVNVQTARASEGLTTEQDVKPEPWYFLSLSCKPTRDHLQKESFQVIAVEDELFLLAVVVADIIELQNQPPHERVQRTEITVVLLAQHVSLQAADTDLFALVPQPIWPASFYRDGMRRARDELQYVFGNAMLAGHLLHAVVQFASITARVLHGFVGKVCVLCRRLGGIFILDCRSDTEESDKKSGQVKIYFIVSKPNLTLTCPFFFPVLFFLLFVCPPFFLAALEFFQFLPQSADCMVKV